MKKVQAFDEQGTDVGYLDNNQKWWFDSEYPNSFELFDLDSFYSEHYFKEDHVTPHVVANYVELVQSTYRRITHSDLSSVLEAGCAGGWFTKSFLDQGIDIFAIEGSKCGYDSTIKRGVPQTRIIHHDLRREINLGRKFDIVCCTEVAEHIEPPFSSQLVKTLAHHSDLIWFSFEPPGTNDAHLHHCNEQPEKFWVNLFDFYNYGYSLLPREVSDSCAGRGTHIFYNRDVFTL
jgi:hypothetical protein